MILIPELLLYKILDSAIIKIREEFSDGRSDNNSFLYQLFGGLGVDDYDFFAQAKEIILAKNEENNYQLEVRMFFDIGRAKIPTIHVTIPNSDSKYNGIGFDEGYGKKFEYNDEIHTSFTRSFNSAYSIVSTSGNTYEVLILDYLVKSILISFINTFELVGLQNANISGGDLNLPDSDYGNYPFYGRVTMVSFLNQITVPNFFKEQEYTSYFLENITKLIREDNKTVEEFVDERVIRIDDEEETP